MIHYRCKARLKLFKRFRKRIIANFWTIREFYGENSSQLILRGQIEGAAVMLATFWWFKNVGVSIIIFAVYPFLYYSTSPTSMESIEIPQVTSGNEFAAIPSISCFSIWISIFIALIIFSYNNLNNLFNKIIIFYFKIMIDKIMQLRY